MSRLSILAVLFIATALGTVFTSLMPIAYSNVFFIMAIPVVAVLFLIMMIDMKGMLVVLLFTRVLLDPVLENTKLSVGGEAIGIGGVLNLFIILVAVTLIMQNPRKLYANRFIQSWVLFLAICGLQVISSPIAGKATKSFLSFISYMLIAAVPFLVVNDMKDKKFWMSILFASSFLPVLIADIDLMSGGNFYKDTGMRISGTFTHPNILAFYLVLVIAILLCLIKDGGYFKTRFRKSLAALYMVNLLVLLFASKTRSAWIGCWVMLLVYGMLKDRRYVFISLVLPLLAALHPSVSGRIRDLSTKTSMDEGKGLNSFAWRLELWKSSLPWIREKFFFGHGLSSFRFYARDFFTTNTVETDDWMIPAHNVYIELLFETGIWGLLSYLLIFGNVLKAFFKRVKEGKKRLKHEHAIVIGYTIGYVLVSSSDNMLHYLTYNWYHWFFIGVLLKGLSITEENEKEKSLEAARDEAERAYLEGEQAHIERLAEEKLIMEALKEEKKLVENIGSSAGNIPAAEREEETPIMGDSIMKRDPEEKKAEDMGMPQEASRHEGIKKERSEMEKTEIKGKTPEGAEGNGDDIKGVSFSEERAEVQRRERIYRMRLSDMEGKVLSERSRLVEVRKEVVAREEARLSEIKKEQDSLELRMKELAEMEEKLSEEFAGRNADIVKREKELLEWEIAEKTELDREQERIEALVEKIREKERVEEERKELEILEREMLAAESSERQRLEEECLLREKAEDERIEKERKEREALEVKKRELEEKEKAEKLVKFREQVEEHERLKEKKTRVMSEAKRIFFEGRERMIRGDLDAASEKFLQVLGLERDGYVVFSPLAREYYEECQTGADKKEKDMV